jgi:hypothetical protein
MPNFDPLVESSFDTTMIILFWTSKHEYKKNKNQGKVVHVIFGVRDANAMGFTPFNVHPCTSFLI